MIEVDKDAALAAAKGPAAVEDFFWSRMASLGQGLTCCAILQ